MATLQQDNRFLARAIDLVRKAGEKLAGAWVLGEAGRYQIRQCLSLLTQAMHGLRRDEPSYRALNKANHHIECVLRHFPHANPYNLGWATQNIDEALQALHGCTQSGPRKISAVDMKPNRAAWLKGPPAACNLPPAMPAGRAWRFVLLGVPGAGKGTHAELLSDHLGACHLSTRNIFRAAKHACNCSLSPAMTVALEAMRRGELVCDDTVLDILRERAACLRCHVGFLLDGFPRTVAQAQALQQLLNEQSLTLHGVISYEIPVPQIIARLSGRRTCTNCKALFHVTARPSKVPGACDQCGGKLIQRDNDRPESIRVRTEAYQKSTAPLIDFYASSGLLIPISADGNSEEILRRTLTALRRLIPAGGDEARPR